MKSVPDSWSLVKAEPMHKVLFIFSWLVVGGEETEVRLLAKNLDPSRYSLDVVACFHKPGMPDIAHKQLEALGVAPDTTPYSLSFAETVRYLTEKIPHYSLLVACQAVPDVYPALQSLPLHLRPPLIEHGGLVSEALAGPKELTARYVGVCASIRDAAASVMPACPHHALEIPSMVDIAEFDRADREAVRRELGFTGDVLVIGWVGRLDRKKRVEDFIKAAALVHAKHPHARFLVVGGPDAFMPEYAGELVALSSELGLADTMLFLGDRPDVPRLLSGLDIFVWLSREEGMPHVISEAGAAGLPVVATRDNGSEEQITDGETGIFVPHESPGAIAHMLCMLLENPALRSKLGAALRAKVEREYSTEVVARQWEALFDEVIEEARHDRS